MDFMSDCKYITTEMIRKDTLKQMFLELFLVDSKYIAE